MAPEDISPEHRRVLLLQGPCSFFFSYLGEALRAHGAEVHRILLCPGDALFWRGGGAISYRGRAEAWPGFVAWTARQEGITDMVCLGDGRSWHAQAIAALRPLGIRIHVVEQGYLRPSRLTVERDGTGGNTRFPRDWPGIEALAANANTSAQPNFRAGFLNYATMDVAWNLANLMAGPVLYPHYRPHALDGPLRDWRGWIGKLLATPWRQRRAAQAMDAIKAHTGPVFGMALQLETDFQIRLHGPPGGLRAALEGVLQSFAHHAPSKALLLVKQHPLDNGLAGWRDRVAGRAVFLDGGDLDTVLSRASGLITVNSTVGLTALAAGVPVKTLGRAIYDLPGLTHQGSIDRFWTAPDPVSPDRLTCLLRALEHIHVHGNFDGEGARPGAEAMAERILLPEHETVLPIG